MRHLATAYYGLCIFLLGLACIAMGGCNSFGPGPTETVVENVPDYLASLPPWEDFSPLQPETEPQFTGEMGDEVTEVIDVERITEEGEVVIEEDVEITCQAEIYSLSKNPQEFMMFNPNSNILWAGGLIQGATHKDPLGTLDALPIEERAPLEITISDIATSENTRVVTDPTKGKVEQARGEMIEDLMDRGVRTPSDISFQFKTYHSEAQMALQAGVSAKYLGFQANASGSFDQNLAETTVAVEFYHKMYTVDVSQPATPADFFTDELTPERLQEHVDRGRIGPNNLPVYVSSITYGRMMMFTLTSTASETEIQSALNAAYNKGFGGGSIDLSAKQKTILQESEISIVTVGGDAEDAIAMIRSGDWRSYFDNVPSISTARPLSYTFSYLDGTPAKVSEITEFGIKECSQRGVTPAIFDFQEERSLNLTDINMPVETRVGDFNGDGNEDLLFSSSDGGTNQVKVALSDGNGSFMLEPTQSHPQTGLPWSSYELRMGDFNGDGNDDLAWNLRTANTNDTYLALSAGGQFSFPAKVSRSGGGWELYDFHVADVEGDGKDELIWNILEDRNRANRTWIGRYEAGSENITYQNAGDFGRDWGAYRCLIGDVDGDGGDDMIWNRIRDNASYFGLFGPSGNLTLSDFHPRGSIWDAYDVFVTRGNADARDDLLFNALDNQRNTIYLTLIKGPSRVDYLDIQFHPLYDQLDWSQYELMVGDLDQDGIDDLVWNNSQDEQRIENWVYVALGTADGKYNFRVESQVHPKLQRWSGYTTYLMDIDGNGRKDLVWIAPSSGNTSLYVGLSQ